jgi:hypothetical protein
MKSIYSFSLSISCLLLFFLSTSCKKDEPVSIQSICETCKTDTGKEKDLNLTSLYLNDSNWVRQGTTYISDLTSFLQASRAKPSQVRSMHVFNDNMILKIFPYSNASYMGGTLFGNVDLSGNDETCTITFISSDTNMHSGQIPYGGVLPFTSVLIKIMIKEN